MPSLADKVAAIFRELAGDRASSLEGTKFPGNITSAITAAIAAPDATDEQILEADRVSFHLTDWTSEAAFLVALHLYPERFTVEEVRDGIESFLLHVPRHVIQAARLSGHFTEDMLKDE